MKIETHVNKKYPLLLTLVLRFQKLNFRHNQKNVCILRDNLIFYLNKM